MGLEGFWKVSRELASLSRRRTRWLVGLADPQEPIQSIMPSHADQIIQHRSYFGSRYKSGPCANSRPFCGGDRGFLQGFLQGFHQVSYKAFTRLHKVFVHGVYNAAQQAFTRFFLRRL